ncbi:GntR family transcriptional regulator [Enterococcus lactis]|uniref:GntR family transcriptional regulator n=1 Tax=Enterococcus lactis TaxID=357441 RepID=UPI0022E12B6A|nr:GntR family transcriptional regulator [Enterococcus lactis]
MKRTRVLYLEVADKIKEDIFSGKYPVGSMLPTESELEELFQVSKITVRKAIELLASDEYVAKKSGRGTTVLSNRPYNRLSKAASFTQILENSRYEVRKETLDLQLVHIKKEDPLFSFFGEQAVCFKRLYYLNNQPYIYFVHYLPQEMMQFSREEFEFLTEEEQGILKTDAQIGIKRIRKSSTQIGEMIEYSEAVYHTELHPYHIDYET